MIISKYNLDQNLTQWYFFNKDKNTSLFLNIHRKQLAIQWVKNFKFGNFKRGEFMFTHFILVLQHEIKPIWYM